QECILQNAVLKGAYVVTVTGTPGSPVWPGFMGPVAYVAREVFDGLGNFETTIVSIATANPPVNVTLSSEPHGKGVYTLNRDCTGSLTIFFAPAPDAHFFLIASPDGRQITMIATDKGDVMVGTATRQDHN